MRVAEALLAVMGTRTLGGAQGPQVPRRPGARALQNTPQEKLQKTIQSPDFFPQSMNLRVPLAAFRLTGDKP